MNLVRNSVKLSALMCQGKPGKNPFSSPGKMIIFHIFPPVHPKNLDLQPTLKLYFEKYKNRAIINSCTLTNILTIFCENHHVIKQLPW